MVRLPGGICHSPDKYLTLACNTHMALWSLVCQTLQLQSRPAQAAALLLSCLWEIIQTRQGQPESKVWHLTGTWKTRCCTLDFWLLLQVNFPTIHMQSQSCQKYLHAKTHRGFCVSVDCGWWCFVHTKRHLSGGRQGKKRKGVGDYFASWVVCPHLWENSIFTFCN